jgi:hypothetical protein
VIQISAQTRVLLGAGIMQSILRPS